MQPLLHPHGREQALLAEYSSAGVIQGERGGVALLIDAVTPAEIGKAWK